MKVHSKRLIQVLREIDPRIGVEVGVWKGENAAALLRAFPNLALMMVDKYTVLSDEEKRYNRRLAKCTQQDFCDAFEAAYQLTMFAYERRWIVRHHSLDAAQIFPDGHFDFAFIDAAHDYESVHADILAWVEKVREGGYICGHDYSGRGDHAGLYGVKRAVDEIFGDRVCLPGGLVWAVKV